MGGMVSFPEYKPPRPSPEELEWARTFVRPNSVEARVWETVTDLMDDCRAKSATRSTAVMNHPGSWPNMPGARRRGGWSAGRQTRDG